VLRAALPVGIGALVLRLIYGVGFANYDTLYALSWGGQIGRGELPDYAAKIAPTPHPLIELLGLLLAPLPAHVIESVTVALGYLALSGCGWVTYRLGARWLGRPAGALAALILLTRVPILSYGSRAYVDVPYLLLVLSALLVESRRRRAGTPVLVLLALAGLLRPEAWAFSGLYWLYLADWMPSFLRVRIDAHRGPKTPDAKAALGRRELVQLGLLAACAPLIWVLSDLAVTGNPLWSLTNTRDTAQTLGRATGIANVPEYIPRRIGEILQVPVLLGAALGGVLSLRWLGDRARLAALAGVLAVVVFAVFASVGLPINSRYAFLIAAILCVFYGAGVFGWRNLSPSDRRRPWWMGAAALLLLVLLAYAPSEYRSAHHELSNLARQQRIQNELLALVKDGRISLRCGRVEVTNHAPIPLLALYLKTSPGRIVSAQSEQIKKGTYVEPADAEVQKDYILDRQDPPPREVNPPPGFRASSTSRSWLVFESC
jgi:hypothetical protein